MELPPPISEKQPTPQSTPETTEKSREVQNPAQFETSSQNKGAAAAVPPIQLPQYTPQPLPVNKGVAVQDDNSQQSGVQLAQDKDLIEKEWVNKAKRIVQSTRDNPYKQTEDLTILKADYMQKKFNKTLKISK